jgi:hypothetical protein
MAMLGAPVSRITKPMISASEENASNEVRNFSDEIGQLYAALVSKEWRPPTGTLTWCRTDRSPGA